MWSANGTIGVMVMIAANRALTHYFIGGGEGEGAGEERRISIDNVTLSNTATLNNSIVLYVFRSSGKINILSFSAVMPLSATHAACMSKYVP